MFWGKSIPTGSSKNLTKIVNYLLLITMFLQSVKCIEQMAGISLTAMDEEVLIETRGC